MDIPSTEIIKTFKENTDQPEKWLLTNTRGKRVFFQFDLEEAERNYLSYIGKEVIEQGSLSNQSEKIDTFVLGNATEFMSDVDRLVDDALPFLKDDGVLLFWINHNQNSLQVKSIVSLILYMHKKNFRIEQVIRSSWTGFIAIPISSSEIDFAENLLSILSRIKQVEDNSQSESQNQNTELTSKLLKRLVESKEEKLNLVNNERKILEQANKMEKELNLIKKRYKALSSSKLGRLTLAYWRYKSQKRKNR
ncbi:hypothetical protein INQ56_16715 [Bacillus altitudinis]|uniref:hypothetical protein n=1 Tax=Bacillus altitudinis TaxID=293387 RepID=UPI00187E167E|nr:hypothetical protein [Bacillus altitudinis]MCY7451057.1 hypothetical protein [Bacillus altitudinis]MCY7713969.1 hypothetical protein [Bacillus altitudinis]MDM5164658.1 hypothetical protein [Bacillus altitudinis]QOV51640.1 hypothetical protein INQ56_16715 [Bacillus altitudinis]